MWFIVGASMTLRPISPKRSKSMRILRAIRRAKVAHFGHVCQLHCSPNCRRRDEGLHHVRKRRGPRDDTAENTLLSCNPCNEWVESNHAKARRLGLEVSGHKHITPTPGSLPWK